jgi:hypothetical protein
MQKPFPSLLNPKDPEPFSLFILDIEIIARAEMSLPPLPGDAFWADAVGDAMSFCSVRELDGFSIAVVGRRNHHADFDGAA